MLIPIGDHQPTTRTPWATRLVLAACVVIFAGAQPWWADGCAQAAFFLRHAVVPLELIQGAPLTAAQLTTATACPVEAAPDKSLVVSVLASMFLHGGWFHLLGNVLFLGIFGPAIEDRLGKVGFLGFYLACGIAATLGYVAAHTTTMTPLVGASGAIAGVLGAYAVRFPLGRVTTLVVPLFFLPLRLPALVVLGFWFVMQLHDAGGDVVSAGGGVAYLAHVIGFLAGAIGMWLLGGRPRRQVGRRPPRRPGGSR